MVRPSLFVVGGLAVWASAAMHLRLYTLGYSHVPTIGALFLAQAIVGVIAGSVVLAMRTALVGLAGAVYLLASLGGFLTSLWFGLFGFSDTFAAPYARPAFAVEAAGAVALLAGALASWARRTPSPPAP